MAHAQFDPKAMVDFDSLWPRGLFPDAVGVMSSTRGADSNRILNLQMSHIKSFLEFVKCCVRLEKGLQAHPPQYSGAIPGDGSEDTPVISYTPSPSPSPESQPGPSEPKGKKRKATEQSSKRSKRRRR
ncbi:hypothetical protein K435DRAFT_875114 [Dendrothele bispora CBS 962.96]|nr:hypothetical protein K435DRAFT_875114 [Dendrothele bispora CBS 962.96]